MIYSRLDTFLAHLPLHVDTPIHNCIGNLLDHGFPCPLLTCYYTQHVVHPFRCGTCNTKYSAPAIHIEWLHLLKCSLTDFDCRMWNFKSQEKNSLQTQSNNHNIIMFRFLEIIIIPKDILKSTSYNPNWTRRCKSLTKPHFLILIL